MYVHTRPRRRLARLWIAVTAVCALFAALGATSDARADELTDQVTPDNSSYSAPGNMAGGVGDVQASWHNAGPSLTSVSVLFAAPAGQYFQRSGLGMVWMLGPDDDGVWRLVSQPQVDTCAVDRAGTSIECDSLGFAWPPDATISVRFPTYVAQGTPVTGDTSVATSATARLTSGTLTVASPVVTVVAGVDSTGQSTDFTRLGSRVLSGAANPGTSVSVETEDGKQFGATTTGIDGAWSVALAPGFGYVRAHFSTVDGIETYGPFGYYNSYAFSVASPRAGSTVVGRVLFTGTAQPGSSLTIRDDSASRTAATTATADGSWRLEAVGPLAPGLHHFLVSETTSDGTTHVLPVDVTVAAPVVPAVIPASSTIIVAPGERAANGEDTRDVILHVVDGAGKPIVGARVHFSTTAPLELSMTEAITDVRGVAMTTVVATGSGAGTVSATVDGAPKATSPTTRFGAT